MVSPRKQVLLREIEEEGEKAKDDAWVSDDVSVRVYSYINLAAAPPKVVLFSRRRRVDGKRRTGRRRGSRRRGSEEERKKRSAREKGEEETERGRAGCDLAIKRIFLQTANLHRDPSSSFPFQRGGLPASG